MTYTVVQAGPGDAAALADQRVAFQRALGAAVPDAGALRREVMAYVAGELGRTLWAFLVRDEVTGLVVASAWLVVVVRIPGGRHGNGRMGVVLNVYTDPDHRHRGLARRLMHEVIETARALDLARLELAATPPGRPLYEALGFTPDVAGSVPMELALGADAARA